MATTLREPERAKAEILSSDPVRGCTPDGMSHPPLDAAKAASDDAREQGLSVDAVREATSDFGEKVSAVAESAKRAAQDKADEPRLGPQTA